MLVCDTGIWEPGRRPASTPSIIIGTRLAWGFSVAKPSASIATPGRTGKVWLFNLIHLIY
jgi:hypothetical protein